MSKGQILDMMRVSGCDFDEIINSMDEETFEVEYCEHKFIFTRDELIEFRDEWNKLRKRWREKWRRIMDNE